jgi:hypothetical protein
MTDDLADPADELRGAILAELAEAGRSYNVAIARLGRASAALADAVGHAKADGITDLGALLELAHIADPSRELARAVIRDAPPAS